MGNGVINYKLSSKTQLRELFILNQLQNAGHIPTYAPQGDLSVDGYTFEIGGKNKNEKQIKGVKKSYLVLDGIVAADKGKILLYLFGFLY
ncbi:hypothetical protein KKC83_03380 [Patescibacteria group bacterium]|nr:hypothetical protein [Candidatus Falkowbacteria bacterium]MBU4026555.1 hypothetical protein [Patescibacteria group bacterium]MBU4124728.1 hypothetical protein [Patescibacteria group bacterium]